MSKKHKSGPRLADGVEPEAKVQPEAAPESEAETTTPTTEEEKPEAVEPPKAAVRPARKVFIVGSGRAVTTKIGRQYGEGETVTDDMFDGGSSTTAKLVAKGALVQKV